MPIFALDTCLAACSVAVTADGGVLAARSEPMVRGHQERLGTMVAETMAEAGLAFADLDRIGVTVGPGSFTGLRVGLAFAKGLAQALDRPCVGVGALQAMAFERPGLVAAVVDARRGQVYIQVLRDGLSVMDPACLRAEDAVGELRTIGAPLALIGSGAHLLAEFFPQAVLDPDAVPDPVSVARLAATSDAPPRPLYLRAPDAALPA